MASSAVDHVEHPERRDRRLIIESCILAKPKGNILSDLQNSGHGWRRGTGVINIQSEN